MCHAVVAWSYGKVTWHESMFRFSKLKPYNKYKVETPIRENIRELVIWECKEHGAKP